MPKSFFDFDDGDFVFTISDNTAIDFDGNMMMRMSDNLAMDLDTGDVHLISSWTRDDDDEDWLWGDDE